MYLALYLGFILLFSLIDLLRQRRRGRQLTIFLILVLAAAALTAAGEVFAGRTSLSGLLIGLIDDMGGLGF